LLGKTTLGKKTLGEKTLGEPALYQNIAHWAQNSPNLVTLAAWR
jgi:hypothetical protein